MNKKGSIRLIVAALCALVGLAVYLVSSFTGYLAASAVDMKPILFSVIALVLLAASFMAGDKLPGLCSDVMLLAAAALIIASFALFTLARVPLAADIYFIPVNYPAAEETAFYLSLVGIIGYLLSILVLILEGFLKKEN